MKKVLVTAVTGGVGQPIKSGTVKFMQDSLTELILSTLNAVGGAEIDSSVPTVLYGVQNTGSGSNYVISAGAVLYNGEVYLVPAATFTAGTGAVFVLVKSYYTDATADPTKLTDGSFQNVHEIRTIEVQDGSSSTSGYIDDFANLKVFSNDWYQKTLVAADTTQAAICGGGHYLFKVIGKTMYLYFDAAFSGSFSSSVNAIGFKIPNGYKSKYGLEAIVGNRVKNATGVGSDGAVLRVKTGANSDTIYMFSLDNGALPNPTPDPYKYSAFLTFPIV
jgi:hypothetical protein